MIKERSFESQLSPGSSVSSLPRENLESYAGKTCPSSGEKQSTDWNSRRTLPLIDAEDVPNTNGKSGQSIQSPKDLQNLNTNPQLSQYDSYWDKPLQSAKESNPRTKADSKYAGFHKDEAPKEQCHIRKSKKYYKSANRPRQTDQNEMSPSHYRSTKRKLESSPQSSPGSSAMFDIDDAIEGTSDAIRDLLHTSDAIDDVMNHTSKDIENVLE